MTTKHLIAAALCAAMLTALCGCAQPADAGGGEETTAATEPVSAELTITADDAVSGRAAVIRSDTSSREMTNEAVRLRKAIEEKLGTTMVISTDWKANPTYEIEIVVGETLREQDDGCDLDRVSLGELGYAVIKRGQKVFVTGGSDVTTAEAIDAFISAFVTPSDGTAIAIPDGYEDIHAQEYEISDILIAGEGSAAYPIVCAEGDSSAAEYLRDIIYSKTGVMHEIVTGEYDGNAFVLESGGDTPQGTVSVIENGGSLYFSQNCGGKMDLCVEKFCDRYFSGAFGALNFPEGFSYMAAGDTLIFIG